MTDFDRLMHNLLTLVVSCVTSGGVTYLWFDLIRSWLRGEKPIKGELSEIFWVFGGGGALTILFYSMLFASLGLDWGIFPPEKWR